MPTIEIQFDDCGSVEARAAQRSSVHPTKIKSRMPHAAAAPRRFQGQNEPDVGRLIET